MGMRREDYAPLLVQDDLTGLHNRRSLLQILKGRSGREPVALVLFDFERFRTVNEQLGRARGGQLLRDFADRLRQATGPSDTLARHGGDSFALLLRGRTRDEAAVFVEQFLADLIDPPLLGPAERQKADPPIAAGVAGFPDDGQSPDAVLEAASRALFAAKRAGGKRVAVSGKLDENVVAERRSLDALPSPTFEGRTVELASADEFVAHLRGKQSSVLLVQGDPGVGKSRFLRETARKASTAAIRSLHMVGAASRKQVYGSAFLIAVNRHFATRPDLVDGLQRQFDAPRRSLLADLVPSLASWRPEKEPAAPSDPVAPEAALKELFLAIAGSEPFLVLVDEAQHVDRGTLDLIRSLVDDPALAVGAALAVTGNAAALRPERNRALVEFIADFTRAKKLQAVHLGPLPEADLIRIVEAILPGFRRTGRFAETLAEASRGNPLYLTEAIRSMILRGRVLKTGDGWNVTPIERADLPPTVEDVLRSVFEALGPEAYELTGRAAVLGAQFDLHTLQETLGRHEAAVQDDVDVAAAAGVIRPVPAAGLDDWEFTSGHARDVRYRLLTKDSRLKTHRRASAVLRLRAVDQAGVRAEMIFHAQVARGAQELAEVEESTEPARPARPVRLEEAREPLARDASEAAFAFLDALKACVRLRRIYPQWKQVADSYRDKAWKTWTALAKKSPRVTFSTAPRELRVNGLGYAVDSGSEFPELRLLLVDRLVGTLTLGQHLEERELDSLIAGLAAPMNKPTTPSEHWDDLLEREGMSHVDIVQRRYVVKESETATVRLSGLAPERLLRGEDLKLFWRAMRFLKGAAENLRLYPPGQELTDAAFLAAANSIEQLLDEAGRITVRREEDGLLINGLAASPDEGREVAAFLSDELRTKRLASFSLMAGAPQDELRVLVSVLAVTDIVTAEGIIAGTRTRQLVFRIQEEDVPHDRISDLHLPVVTRPERDEDAVLEEVSEPIPIGPVRNASPGYLVIRVDLRARACLISPIDYFLSERSEKELPLMIETLRFGDLDDLADALVTRVASCLGEKSASWRRRAILMATRLLADASGESRDKLISTLREPLQACLLEETDPDSLRLLAEAVRSWAKGALDARRLPLLAGFLSAAVRPKLDAAATPREFKMSLQSKLQTLAADGGGEPALDMLRNSAATLRHMAIQILSVLGAPMIPPLTEIVATHPSSEVRRMAAVALKEIGGTAQQDLARLVRAEAASDRITHVLEVLELAGPGNVATPVHEALRHPDPKVGREAVNLVGRVERPVAIATVRWVLMKDEFTVRSIALDMVKNLKLTELASDVARLLQEPAGEELMKVVCRALAEVPTPSAIPHLRRIFDQKGRAFGFVKGLSEETRALAVAAAAVIDHPDAKALTALAANDKSAVVRDAAQGPIRKK